MALLATNRFAGDGATTSYEFNFVGKYIARSHVKVYQEDNATKVRTYVSITDGNFLNDTTLHSLPATPVGSTLVIYRETPKPPVVDFVNGSRFTEYNMDLVARQGLFVAMEAMDAGDAEARQGLLDAITIVEQHVHGVEIQAAAAAASALAASTSASNALASARAAGTAQTGAETARDAANTSAANALESANSASTSASNANTHAENALASKNAAATSATAAGTSATNALNSKNAAATSATNAATSATNASGYASTASTKAEEATTSATNAANSAKQAQTYANSVNPATFVNLTGAQTISGPKTFVGTVVVPNVVPHTSTTAPLNYNSISSAVVKNGYGTMSGVTNNVIYLGWKGYPSGVVLQVDASGLGSLLSSGAVSNIGAIGCLAFAHYRVPATKTFGDQVYGSDLFVSSAGNSVGTALPGIWVCLGHCQGHATDTGWTLAKTLFMRVT